MAEPSGNKQEKQVMDVSKPGKSPADASARPIIVGHGPRVQDPMVNTPEDDNPDTAKAESAAAVSPSSKKVIVPLTTQKNAPEEAKDQVDETPEPAPEPTAETDSSESAVVDAVVDQVSTKNKEAQVNEEDKKKQEAIDKLVLEKKYFVPIGKARHKRKARWALIAAFVLLFGVGGALVAADAGLVDLGFKPPMDFIKDTDTTTADEAVPVPQKSNSNALQRIQVPISETTKLYTDTAAVYSLSYPDNWTVTELTQGTEGPLPDPTKVSRVIGITFPNAPENTTIIVSADTTGALKGSVQQNWTDNKHEPKAVKVNNYDAQYVQVVFKGDAENYTDETYLITDQNATVYITFRKNYYHQFPAQNWDASAAVPGFESILNSIKFL